jgi:hypothetical protein
MTILPLHIVALLSLEPDYDLIAARARYHRSGQRGRAAARTIVSPAQRAAVPLPRPRPPLTFDDRFTAAYGERKW